MFKFHGQIKINYVENYNFIFILEVNYLPWQLAL